MSLNESARRRAGAQLRAMRKSIQLQMFNMFQTRKSMHPILQHGRSPHPPHLQSVNYMTSCRLQLNPTKQSGGIQSAACEHLPRVALMPTTSLKRDLTSHKENDPTTICSRLSATTPHTALAIDLLQASSALAPRMRVSFFEGTPVVGVGVPKKDRPAWKSAKKLRGVGRSPGQREAAIQLARD